VLRIQEILALLRIIGSVPEKTDMDTYKCLWIFGIKVIFLVVLKCNIIQKCILPCENFNFVTKISRNFVIFRDTKFREIKNYLAKYEIKISRQRNFVDHPFPKSKSESECRHRSQNRNRNSDFDIETEIEIPILTSKFRRNQYEILSKFRFRRW
jgi:hypothetical protein